jgi:ankyrin repeat protein
MDLHGLTPLHWASRLACVEKMKLLLSLGAQVHAADHEGRTPLYVAAAGGHVRAVQLLLSRGADVRIPSKAGRTPLQVSTGDVTELLKAFIRM